MLTTGHSIRLQFLLSLLFLFLLTVQPVAVFGSATVDLHRTSEPTPTTDQRAVQVLSRLTFGARPGDLGAVKKIGVRAFIDSQLAPDNIDDSALQKRLDKLPTLSLANPTIAELYNPPKPAPSPSPSPSAKTVEMAATSGLMTQESPTPAASPTPSPKPTPPPRNPGMVVNELQRAKLLRAVYSERQLYEVMVDFWENHFSIFANKDADRLLLTGFDRDSIRPFALGRFRDLLGATAHSPAMLFYLDNWQSSVVHNYPATKDKPARKTGGINENYARELMELHTLGVNGGYTQKDVEEVARCFTGWTIRKPNEEGIFFYNPAQHDNGEKIVLGQKIPAGGGIADGERVLDILAKSPATAKFVVTKMARRFVGDNPPASLIARASAVYLRTDGSIAETLRSIITSPEFFSPTAYRTKVKSPFEYVASALRATNAETDANSPILGWIARMGQPVYGRVTPDGYPDVSSGWLSNNDLLARFNFVVALTSNTIKGTKVDVTHLVPAEPGDKNLAAKVAQIFLIVRPSNETRNALDKLVADTQKSPASQQPVMTTLPSGAVQWTTRSTSIEIAQGRLTTQLIALVLGSPEFQRK
jgi:uncharacterized protein (DUF1800 family)